MEMRDYEESGQCSLVEGKVMNFSEVVSITYCSPLGSHLLFSPLLVEGHPGSFFTGPLLYCLYLLGSYKKAWTVPIGHTSLSPGRPVQYGSPPPFPPHSPALPS